MGMEMKMERETSLAILPLCRFPAAVHRTVHLTSFAVDNCRLSASFVRQSMGDKLILQCDGHYKISSEDCSVPLTVRTLLTISTLPNYMREGGLKSSLITRYGAHITSWSTFLCKLAFIGQSSLPHRHGLPYALTYLGIGGAINYDRQNATGLTRAVGITRFSIEAG